MTSFFTTEILLLSNCWQFFVSRDDHGKIMGSKSGAQQFQRLLTQLRTVGPGHMMRAVKTF
jgi:hypothetical protein